MVTLEPCSSTGKTGPCVQAILDVGFPNVVVGGQDPDPRHRGRASSNSGPPAWRSLDPVPAPLERVAPHFLRWSDWDRIRRPHPWTVAKWAQTLTGQLSPPRDVGEGRWISCGASLEEVQCLRGRVDAIVTGVGTVLADDPRLTLRRGSAPITADGRQALPLGENLPERGAAPAPARVILDSWLRTPPEARVFAEPVGGERGGDVHVVTLPGADPIRRRALEAVGAKIHLVREPSGSPGPPFGLGVAVGAGLPAGDAQSGPTLLRNALEAGLVDQLRVYTGSVRGGEGESLAGWLVEAPLGAAAPRVR